MLALQKWIQTRILDPDSNRAPHSILIAHSTALSFSSIFLLNKKRKHGATVQEGKRTREIKRSKARRRDQEGKSKKARRRRPNRKKKVKEKKVRRQEGIRM